MISPYLILGRKYRIYYIFFSDQYTNIEGRSFLHIIEKKHELKPQYSYYINLLLLLLRPATAIFLIGGLNSWDAGDRGDEGRTANPSRRAHGRYTHTDRSCGTLGTPKPPCPATGSISLLSRSRTNRWPCWTSNAPLLSANPRIAIGR